MTFKIPDNVDSKFRYILISSARAKQLQNGARQRMETKSRKATYIAMQEVSNKLINFELFKPE